MAVDRIEKYRQLNGDDVLKVFTKPTKAFPEGACFYCDASDEELVKSYAWFLYIQKHPYVIVNFRGTQTKRFHREKAYNILGNYPDYINHIDGVEFDNANINLDVVSQQQNIWCAPSRGYSITGQRFQPRIVINYRNIFAKRTKTEIEACQVAYQLELQYEDYRYDFLKDRRKDIDLLDLERTGQISEDEAVYRHVLRYADNAWYIYRYNLFSYFRDNRIPIPAFSTDINGFMCHPVTGHRLCPL